MHSIWLVLVLSVLSSSVRAGTFDNLRYEIADGEVTITGKRILIEGEVVIPDEIEEQFGDKIDLLIDDGIIKNSPSKIFIFEKNEIKRIR